MSSQLGGGMIVTAKEFDLGTRGSQTKRVEIPWRQILGSPDEKAIAATVNKYTQTGWVYAARRESEGLFGFGAHSTLTFTKLPHHVRREHPAKKPGCLATLLVWMVKLVVLAFVAYFLLMLVAGYG